MKQFAVFAFLIAGALPAAAQGLIIPDEPDLPPLAITRHDVRVSIDNQAAVTTVEQLFVNNTEKRLQAQFVFPIPKDAAASAFSLTVDGKKHDGEMLEKTQAREIFESLIRRAQDPTLLEQLGGRLFRASIVIDPKAKQLIALQFSEVLTAENALVRYLYPVRNGATRGATVNGDFSVEVSIKSNSPIGNVYSPSHAVTVTRDGANAAKATFSAKNVTLTKDFQLYYGLTEKALGVNLITYRPDPKEPGTFLMLVTPRSLKTEKVVMRDVVFVLDTSGSMKGEKIQQAKNALKQCISTLNDGDRFNLITFSSYVDTWKKELVPAAEFRKAALERVDAILAEGATDIDGALKAALSFPQDPNRPYVVIFMTDGKPTVGDATDPKIILAKAERAKSDSLRIFTWGVGYDVDTTLLDGIAAATGGVSEYVHPEEDIATKLATFWGRTSRPVLTNLELLVDSKDVQLVGMLPSSMPDLYAGGQLVLVGRYTGSGDVKLKLTGRVNGEKETFEYAASFPATQPGNAFVELLWAKRRIGQLLDTIRMKGENKELVDDVVRLSKQYGIETPYTSYLIHDDGKVSSTKGGGAGGGSFGGRDAKKLDHMADKDPAKPAAAQGGDRERKEKNEEAQALDEGFRAKDGKSSVDAASYLRKLKESDRDGGASAAFKPACGTRLFAYRGLWVDERFTADAAVTTVQFGSKAWLRIAKLHPEIKEALKVGTSIVFVTAKGKALAVACDGEKELTDDAIQALFK